jgi:cell wall assembly regulator SMI1
MKYALCTFVACITLARIDAAPPAKFFEAHCTSCHDAATKKGDLDLASIKLDAKDPENLAKWIRIHDRIKAGEMPPKKKLAANEVAEITKSLHDEIVAAERATTIDGKTRLRRLTRSEYENTIRDLFDMPGIPLQNDLPADGIVHGFDKNSDALDLSHVNLAKYLEAADRVLDGAITGRPRGQTCGTFRTSLAYPAGFVAHVLHHGDGVLLKNKKPDPDFPPAGEFAHLDQGAHERMGSFRNGASVGLFRHEDESFHPYFNEFVTVYPGRYKLRISLWSFQWDKGQVLPSRGTEAARLSIVTLVGDGRGGGHPSNVLTYLDAPSMKEQQHEIVTWLNPRETIGFNAASLVSGHTRGPKRAMGFTGPGIACDYFEVEGPIHETWPPIAHKRLFGDLPIREFKPKDHPGIKPPPRTPDRQQLFMARNKPDPIEGIWTVHSDKPLEDADRLLAEFLPRAFRRPVTADSRKLYVARVAERIKAGDCFELAMRYAYRAALCSADFLYHVEPIGELDDYAIACRLSYFLWNSMPDDKLNALAVAGKLRDAKIVRGEVERMLADPRSKRFVEDFLGQWLKLRQIAANDADRKLYPEFSKYLQDSMVAETHAYFREMLEKNLSADHLVKSDFAMLNGKLAAHYGINGVSGSQIRRVSLPKDCLRGPFLTQAAILKITANGTTTSPVPRGAFVLDRLMGQPPAPPPPNIPAVEPDVRGATTIREQLEKHRNVAVCASCHSKIDPPGFALEEFDVIGGQRNRYRSLGVGDPAPRGNIDPFIGIGFKLGPKVDASGAVADGRRFSGIAEFQKLLAADRDLLLGNLVRQFAIYSTGRGMSFGDRDDIAQIVNATNKNGGGVRSLIHELVQSRLFRTR